jgi:hypothetical protein
MASIYTVIKIEIKATIQLTVFVLATELYTFLIIYKVTVCDNRESLRRLTMPSGSTYTIWQVVVFVALLIGCSTRVF